VPGIEIELPDGTILEAPEGADPSTVAKAYLARQRGEAPPAPAPTGQAAPGFVGPPASPADRAFAEARAQARGEAGAARGVVQGVRQLGQSLGQTAMEGLEWVGALPEGKTQGYTDRVLAQRRQAVEALKGEGLSEADIGNVTMVGENLPLLATPGLRGATFTGTVIKNALLGGAVAGSTKLESDVENESRLGTMTKGAAAGALIGAVPGAVVGSWNYVTRSARELLNSPRAVANAKALDDIGQRAYSIGQQTGDEAMMGLEASVTGPNKQGMLFQQAENVKNRFKTWLDRIAPPAAPRGPLESAGPNVTSTAPPTAARRSRAWQGNAIRDRLAAEDKAASDHLDSLWHTGTRRVQDIAGDTPILRPTALGRKVDELVADQHNVLRNPTSSEVSKQFEAYRAQVQRMAANGATAKELNDLMIGINNIASGRSKIFAEGTEAANQQMAASLRAALFEDVGAMAAPGPAAQQAAQAAAGARTTLQRTIEARRMLRAERDSRLQDLRSSFQRGTRAEVLPHSLGSKRVAAESADALASTRLDEEAVKKQYAPQEEALVAAEANARRAIAADEFYRTGGHKRAADTLLATRSAYRAGARARDDMADSALARFFGGKTTPQPRQMLEFIRSADPEDRAAAVALLQKADPTALRAVRAEAAQAAWKAAFNPAAPEARNSFDIQRFATEINKLAEGGLMNAAQRNEMMRTVDGIRVLLNRVDGPLGKAPAVQADDVAINAISHNPAFIARLIVQATQRNKLDNILFTTAGQRAIRELARTGSTSAKINAATAALIGLTEDRPAEAANEQP